MSNLIDAIRQAWPVLKDDEKKAIESLFMGEKPMWVPFPGPQVRAIDSQADELFYGGSAGGGKMLSLDTPIATPYGWTEMGMLRVGDAVFDESGQVCTVTCLSEIDQNPESYKLVFDDGSEIVACADHQWLTFDADELSRLTRFNPEWRARRRLRRKSIAAGNKSALFTASIAQRNRSRVVSVNDPPTGTVRTTRQLAETLLTDRGRRNHAIQTARPLQLPDDDCLSLHPYLLGLWLGDGSSRDNAITTMDKEIVDAFVAEGFRIISVQHKENNLASTYRLSRLRFFLRTLGVMGKKHIPGAYLRASEQSRLALLQGLMDTDGTVSDTGSPEFDNTNYEIIKGVHELIVSLGWKARIVEGRARLNGKDYGPKWSIKWKPGEYVFRLPRKRDRQVLSTRRVTRFRYLHSCERVDPVPMRCISVDSPSHLYLAGRSMIPTHNSEALLGLALTKHRHSIIFRREYPQLRSMVQRSMHLIGQKGTYNSQSFFWKLKDGRTLEFGACQLEKDTQRYMGRPHDFIGFDEASNFLKQQVIFLMGWNRPADGDAKQRCRVVLTGNPPTSPEGRWIVEEFAPWLDQGYSDQAEPGELRWYAREPDSGLIWRKSPDPIRLSDGEIVKPKSRTFIPARVDDNPVLMASGYKTVLQGLPEPLRSQLLYGDFSVQGEDDPFQVIPTSWVHAAQERWTEDGHLGKEQEVLGVDVARGGSDWTILSARHGNWFAPLLKYKGRATPDGHSVAALVRNALHSHNVAVNIDVIGIGSAAFDVLREGLGNFRPFDGRKSVERRDRSGQLGFINMRAWSWWALREALDPNFGSQIQLPRDPQLLADLCTPRWHASPRGIQIETKDDIHKRIGRSPDAGDAVVLAFLPFYDFTYPTRENQPEMRRSKLFDLERPSSIRNRGWLGLRPK